MPALPRPAALHSPPPARPRRVALCALLPVRRALAPALATSPPLCAKQVRGARGSPLQLAWAREQDKLGRRPETGWPFVLLACAPMSKGVLSAGSAET